MDDLAKEEVDPGKQLDDIRSMNIADVDRARLVNRYLDALIKIVEPASSAPARSNDHEDLSKTDIRPHGVTAHARARGETGRFWRFQYGPASNRSRTRARLDAGATWHLLGTAWW